MNPGDTPPPPRKNGKREAALNEGRGVNPGDTGRRRWPELDGTPLNEGRGVNPGDTAWCR